MPCGSGAPCAARLPAGALPRLCAVDAGGHGQLRRALELKQSRTATPLHSTLRRVEDPEVPMLSSLFDKHSVSWGEGLSGVWRFRGRCKVHGCFPSLTAEGLCLCVPSGLGHLQWPEGLSIMFGSRLPSLAHAGTWGAHEQGGGGRRGGEVCWACLC